MFIRGLGFRAWALGEAQEPQAQRPNSLESPEVAGLLHLPIDPNAAIHGDDTALMLALWRHHFEVVQLLMEAGAQRQNDCRTMLMM